VNAPSFNGIEDPESLYRVLSSIDAVDRRRGGQGVGGSGGSSSSVEWDGTRYVRRGGGGGGAAGAPSGGPRAAIAPAAAGTRGAMHLPDANERLVMAVRARGLDPATPAGLAYQEELREGLTNGSASRQAEVQRIVADALETQGVESSVPASIDRNEFRLLSREAAPIASRIHQLNPLIGALSRVSSPRLAAALHGGPAMARVAGASSLRARIAAYMNQYFHEFGGANITPEERSRYMTAFASDSLAVDPQEFANAMRRAQRLNVREAEGIMSRATRNPQDVVDYYMNSVIHPPRRAR
jgi:hypothetical protein